MLPWTALIKYHLQAPHHIVEVIPPVDMTGPHLGTIATTGILTMIIETGTGPVAPDHTHKILGTGVPAAMTPTGVIPDHFIDLHIIAPHATEAQVHTATTMTHHIAGLHLAEIFPKPTVRSQQCKPYKQHYKPVKGSSSSSHTTPWKHKDRGHKQVTIDDPPSEYYSSDYQDSDSKDDLN